MEESGDKCGLREALVCCNPRLLDVSDRNLDSQGADRKEDI